MQIKLPPKKPLTKNERLLLETFTTCEICGSPRKRIVDGICGLCDTITYQKNKNFQSRDIINYWTKKVENHKDCGLYQNGIPERFKFLLDNEWDKEYMDQGLYLYGPAGTGKTIKVFSIYLNQMRWAFLKDEKTPPDIISVRTLFERIKNTFSGQLSWTEKGVNILSHYQKVKWLCLDDVGIFNTTNWEFSELYSIINYRYEEALPTVFTSNISLDEYEKSLDDHRLTRRIRDMTKLAKVL